MQAQLQPALPATISTVLPKGKRAMMIQNATNESGYILAIAVFGGQASLPQTPRAKRYMLTMNDLFPMFGVGAAMSEQSGQTVASGLVAMAIALWSHPSHAHRPRSKIRITISAKHVPYLVD